MAVVLAHSPRFSSHGRSFRNPASLGALPASVFLRSAIAMPSDPRGDRGRNLREAVETEPPLTLFIETARNPRIELVNPMSPWITLALPVCWSEPWRSMPASSIAPSASLLYRVRTATSGFTLLVTVDLCRPPRPKALIRAWRTPHMLDASRFTAIALCGPAR
jgi:hypothetical protein